MGEYIVNTGLSDGVVPRGGLRTEAPAWFRRPEIILINQPHIGKLSVPSHHRDSLLGMKDQLFADYAAATSAQLGYPARLLADPQDKSTGQVSHRQIERGDKVVEERSPFGIVLDPVIYGELPSDAYEVMRELKSVESQREERGKFPLFFEEEGRKPLMHALRDTLPQIEIPLVLSDGSSVIRNLDMDMKKMRGNFINVVFVQDQDGVIDALPSHWRQTFHWMVISKLGSFKTNIVRYWEGEQGLESATPVIATLEGGYYPLETEQMINQLAVYGSSRATGATKTLDDIGSIPRDTWRSSRAVRNLKALGRTMEDFQLLSPRILVEDVVSEDGVIDFVEEEVHTEGESKRERIRRFASRTREGVQKIVLDARAYREEAAGYSRQAEGAFYHYDPENNLFIVTASGRFGAVKTNLGDEDLTAVLPAPHDNTLVYQLPVEGVETRDSSVEAREFIGPIHEALTSDDPKFDPYKVQVVKEGGAYRLPREGEDVDPTNLQVFPAVLGIVHLHRDSEHDNLKDLVESGEIIEITLPDQLVVGCGVDVMEDQSRKAMDELIQKWNEGGRRAKLGALRVRRHGTNWFMLATADHDKETNADVVDPNAFKNFEIMLRRTETPLRLSHTVVQEHEPVIVFSS